MSSVLEDQGMGRPLKDLLSNDKNSDTKGERSAGIIKEK